MVLLDDTTKDPIATMMERLVVFQATKENFINNIRTVIEYEEKIKAMKEELTST